jgi:hypothetical protein
MKKFVITCIFATIVVFSPSLAIAFAGINLLGESSETAESDDSAGINNMSNITESTISSIRSDEGTRNVNFNLFNKDGVTFFSPEAFGQIFSGSKVTKDGDAYTVERPGGGRLNFMAGLKNVVLSFFGEEVETDIPVARENGNTLLPLDSMGQFFNKTFTQNGGALNENDSTTPQWLQNSWLNTLNTTGGGVYAAEVDLAAAQVEKAPAQAAKPQKKVFRNITATVFCSAETNLKGAYGDWLHSEDLYVALPKRFSGKRPKVQVQGPKGTFTADIKDVGPWNINDPYWETGSRPQAESGRDKSGRRTNLAGIDLSYKLGRILGIGGKGKVNWWFVD